MPKIPIFAAKPSAALERPSAIPAFLTRWSASGAAERANAQSCIPELCTLLGVEPPRPKTPDESANAYVFEKTIPGGSSSKNFIDCYKRGHFVLESKQGADALHTAAPLSMAVAAAYGWPADLPEADILTRLVALNAERQAEASAGRVRWLRPAYQAPEASQATTQARLVLPTTDSLETRNAKLETIDWPAALAEQALTVRAVVQQAGAPLTAEALAARFRGAGPAKVRPLLETLVGLGQLRLTDAGQYAV